MLLRVACAAARRAGARKVALCLVFACLLHPIAAFYKPPKDGHYYRFTKMIQVCGWFNVACSLFVLLLHWKLGLLRQKLTFMAQMILAMTVFQLIQDTALAYAFECQEYSGSDDDTFWASPRVNSKGYSGRRCNHSQFFIEESSGIMLQSLTLQLAIVFFLVVVYAKNFNFSKWLFYVNIFSAVVAIVAASVNTFGSFQCKRQYSNAGVVKTLYSCPPSPDMPNGMTKDKNYFSPGKFAWYFAEQLRLFLAVTSMFVVGCALLVFYRRFRYAPVQPSKSLVMGALVAKIAWYPALQSISRMPCLYVILYGSFWHMDKNRQGDPQDDSVRKDVNTTRVSMGYAYAILAPAGGFLMMVLFLVNNVTARQWVTGLLARAGLIDPPEASSRMSESTMRYSESLGAAGWRKPRAVSVAVLANRCAELDEEDLLRKIDMNAHASEEQWQASLLRATASSEDADLYRGYSDHEEAREVVSRRLSSRGASVEGPSSDTYVARLSLQITESNPLHDLNPGRHVHIKSQKAVNDPNRQSFHQAVPSVRDSTSRRQSLAEYAPRRQSLGVDLSPRRQSLGVDLSPRRQSLGVELAPRFESSN